jgi:purine-binding chemotaxis protein CheW
VRNTAQAIPQLQIVIFRIGPEEFGLDVFTVHEILRYQTITPVPRAPEFVEGVIEVRRTLVPVIDLRRRFEVEVPDADSDTRIILVQYGGERLGLIVDAVSEVLRIPETAVSEPPRYFRGLAAEYIKAIARLPERLVILLDVERVLSSQERIALESVRLADLGEAAATPAPTENG